MNRTARFAIALCAVLVVALSVFAGTSGADDPDAKALIRNSAGAVVGVAHLSQQGTLVAVKVSVSDLAAGFHGFHVHTTGTCTNPNGSWNPALAGGHYAGTGANHGDHAGDQPSLLVNANGTGILRFTTDRYTVAELLAGDGSAFIIHAGRDNFANIPTRYFYVSGTDANDDPIYTAGPDAATNATGDAGGRTGCGVIEAA